MVSRLTVFSVLIINMSSTIPDQQVSPCLEDEVQLRLIDLEIKKKEAEIKCADIDKYIAKKRIESEDREHKLRPDRKTWTGTWPKYEPKRTEI